MHLVKRVHTAGLPGLGKRDSRLVIINSCLDWRCICEVYLGKSCLPGEDSEMKGDAGSLGTAQPGNHLDRWQAP